MNRLALAFALGMGACGPVAAEPHTPPAHGAEDPDRYVSEAGAFTVVFPAAPEVSSKDVETEIGTFTLHNVGVAVLTPGALGAFSVTWANLPAGVEHRMVDTTRALVHKAPRVFISEHEIEIVPGVVKGWELHYEEGDLEKTGRVFEVGRRYYQVLVEYPKGGKPPGMRRFFDTFRLA